MKQVQVHSIKTPGITFGVEVECLLPIGSLPVGGYHNGTDLGNHGFPSGWNSQHDGSLRTTLNRYSGVEIVSPVLSGVEGLTEIDRVFARLAELRVRTNPSCGVHVHIGSTSVVGTDQNAKADWARKMLVATSNFQRAIFGATGTRRRENGDFCQRIFGGEWNRYASFLGKKRGYTELARAASCVSRYQLCNILPLFSQKGTVEIRAFSGTTESAKVKAWVQLVLGLAEKANGNCASFGIPEVGYAGDNAIGAIKRLYYLLGWTLGRKDVGKPHVEVLGYLEPLETLGATKDILNRLCRKYDADNGETRE